MMYYLLRGLAAFFCVALLAPALTHAHAAALSVEVAHPSALPALDPEFLGMVARDPWYDFGTLAGSPNQPNTVAQERMGQMLASAGVRWVRIDIHIGGANIDSEIGKNDYFIQTVAPKYNLKVLALLSFDLLKGQDPRILNTGPYTVTSRFGGGINRAMDTWLTRALAVADRYRGAIHAYEILNEQNRLPYFDPNGYAGEAINPEIAARLMAKFYRFCKNIEPATENHGCSATTPIVLGGLHPRGTSNKPVSGKPETIMMSDTAYLKAIYGVTTGANNQDVVNPQNAFRDFKSRYGSFPIDGVGYHPYPEEVRLSAQLSNVFVDKGLDRMRQSLVGVGDTCNQFWVTEIGMNVGFDTDGPVNPEPAVTANAQATFMDDVYRSLYARQLPIACGSKREVANVFWFKYEDFPPATSKPAQGIWAQQWGIVRIPFTDSATCPGGACYDQRGEPLFVRDAFYTYRQLAGLPVYRTQMPIVKK